jgi:L-aminopeptidase/D-esterase-like protein
VKNGAVAGVEVRGSAPGTRETDLLNPINTVEKVHAIVLSGGSAFGLDSASGVVRYLEEKGIGYDVGVARVPIVPAAILFDLRIGDPGIRPDAHSGYLAAQAASNLPIKEGNVGAGAGATVGKIHGPDRAMKGGIGSFAIVREDGLKVGALVAVNSLGDIIEPRSGKLLAGARSMDGSRMVDLRETIWKSLIRENVLSGNTTIGIVATNANLTKAQVNKLAQMAHNGIARAVYPAHTPHDGDTLFALATGLYLGEADLTLIGTLAANAVAQSIVRAVSAAEGLPGYPSAHDLHDEADVH